MPVKLCSACSTNKAVLRRAATGSLFCKDCFFAAFEQEVYRVIIDEGLLHRGERVAVGASGGKDSTVLAHVLTTLNRRYDAGWDLFLLSIDEGISGYRDDSLATVQENEIEYGIPLTVVSYKQLYGWTMDDIVRQIGTKNNCTYCGVLRRQALDRGAVFTKADRIVTGHNADDIAETVLLNVLRGDIPRLGRCTATTTGGGGPLPRSKPLKYCFEKEIVMYAHFKKLLYFSTECLYAPFAARGLARTYIKDLEAARPRAILDVIQAASELRFEGGTDNAPPPTIPQECSRCGYMTSQTVCKACVLLEGLNKGLPGLGIRRVKGHPVP
mmetsp:Transcript_6508/g.18717  ORF Transcript_6508/g.18717 Transcript_6508/m.18717 type:complete len:327 (-) Transcript_6508:297-1277(-)